MGRRGEGLADEMHMLACGLSGSPGCVCTVAGRWAGCNCSLTGAGAAHPACMRAIGARASLAGRAGHTGSAITFFTEEDAPRLRSIAHLVADAGSEVPDWMLHMAKQPKQRKRRRRAGVGADDAADDNGVPSS